MRPFYQLAYALLLCVAIASCEKQISSSDVSLDAARSRTGLAVQPAVTTPIVENFESGTKAAYADGTVTLSTGVWDFNDALIGNLTTDHKDGTQCARIRNTGTMTMEFDFTGVSAVSIKHAEFGSDGTSTWQLWASTNSGTSFTQVGTTITTNSTTLQTASFTVTATGNIRFQIRKVSGGTNRIDIDDFTVNGGVAGGGGGTTAGGKKFLFDATKAETAGNADWVIDEDNGTPQRTPTPAQSTITASTAETFWTGALSSWGIALVKAGNSVETLPSGTAITFGSTTNAQDLSHYDVFVVDEPNILFTSAEKTAILNFIHNGGGLFLISDHNGSDRNNDGHDSPNIWNDLMTNNTVATNPFGFIIDLTDVSGTSTNVLTGNPTNPILHGSQGNVSEIEFDDGATITTNPTANPAVQGLIWLSGDAQNTTHVMCASSSFGTGRVFAITDSSPMDDGTGAAGNDLFVGWSTLSHTQLFMNASLWLAKLQ